MTKGEAPRPLSQQVLDQWEKQGSNNVAGYITTDLEHKLHLLLVGSAMINNVPLTTVLSFFSNQHLSRRPRQDGNTSPTRTETTTMHYCDYLVIFRDRIGLSTSEALHLYHRYAFNQMFNVSAFVDALGSSPQPPRPARPAPPPPPPPTPTTRKRHWKGNQKGRPKEKECYKGD